MLESSERVSEDDSEDATTSEFEDESCEILSSVLREIMVGKYLLFKENENYSSMPQMKPDMCLVTVDAACLAPKAVCEAERHRTRTLRVRKKLPISRPGQATPLKFSCI